MQALANMIFEVTSLLLPVMKQKTNKQNHID